MKSTKILNLSNLDCSLSPSKRDPCWTLLLKPCMCVCVCVYVHARVWIFHHMGPTIYSMSQQANIRHLMWDPLATMSPTHYIEPWSNKKKRGILVESYVPSHFLYIFIFLSMFEYHYMIFLSYGIIHTPICSVHMLKNK